MTTPSSYFEVSYAYMTFVENGTMSGTTRNPSMSFTELQFALRLLSPVDSATWMDAISKLRRHGSLTITHHPVAQLPAKIIQITRTR